MFVPGKGDEVRHIAGCHIEERDRETGRIYTIDLKAGDIVTVLRTAKDLEEGEFFLRTSRKGYVPSLVKIANDTTGKARELIVELSEIGPLQSA